MTIQSLASTTSVASPLLRLIAPPDAEVLAALWPAPHTAFVTAPAARRHLICLMLAAEPHGGAPIDVARLMDLPLRKAIALGANAVLLGRPQMHALAVAGMLGVAHLLYLLRAELELAMAQTGCASLDRIGPGLLTTC